MEKLKKFWDWVKVNWKFPVLLALFILGWLLFRKRREQGTPLAQTKTEIRALDAEGKAKAKTIELGAAQAKVWVEVAYQVELKALTEAQQAQAKGLANDPPALAAFLVRAGSSQ